ncbi:MAG: hypothetical protein ACK5V5_09365 [Cyclobacteriaceae bacterium]|jgi:hypothetical protein|nr:hypothetical protein [Flammeovirgaceae bacterium]
MNMKATSLNFDLIDSYLELLKSLSPDNRLNLISKLSNSLKRPKKSSDKMLSDLFGAFKTKKSADEMIAELKRSRYFDRNTERL